MNVYVATIMSKLICIGRPEIPTLCNELTSVSEWFTLGLNLGVQHHQLQEIRSNYLQVEGVGGCRRQSLILWLQSTPKASWRDVVGALRQMKEDTEAERIELQYIVRPAHASKLYTIQ